MSPLLKSLSENPTIADLLKHLGGISARRVRLRPTPGTATEKDVIAIHEREDRRFELIDGVLVEKIMGLRESLLACIVIELLSSFVRKQKLGLVSAPDGAIRLAPHLVRIPDVSYFSWSQFPNRRMPREKIPDLAPLLAVEVLSEGNTPGEMRRKLKDYFFAEIKLVWFIDPEKKSVEVFTAPDEFVLLSETDTLDGGAVLPGFRIAVRQLFEDLPEVEEKKPPRKPQKKRK